ncbi:hypothetical protein ACLVWQ_35260 [Streptomyces sp. CWNU-52B]|uniref:hypothetical protein n=1 Tax=unclassified Streptomyces TaxID=2593676 RepID=UPI0039C3507F
MTGQETELPGPGPYGARAGAPAGPGAAPDPSPSAERVTGPPADPPADPSVDPSADPSPGPSAGSEYDPAGPAPLHVPRTPTGDAEVDVLLDRLADVDHLATDGHMEVYEDVHRGLRDALTALDTRPGPSAPPAQHSDTSRKPYSGDNSNSSYNSGYNSNRS